MVFEGHVVLIHAFPLSAELWRHQAAASIPGWRLLTPDLPGFGASAEPVANSVDAMATGVLAAMDRDAIERAVIGGLSMGGYVTLALYRRAPERFLGLVLADTRATADNDQQKAARRKMIETVRTQGPSAVADEMLPKLLGGTTRRERPAVETEIRQMIEANSVDAIAGAVEAMMERPDSTAMLPRIAVPALVLCGAEDTLTPPSDSQALADGIRGSRLEILQGAGHLSAIETPDAFTQTLTSFLASVGESNPR